MYKCVKKTTQWQELLLAISSNKSIFYRSELSLEKTRQNTEAAKVAVQLAVQIQTQKDVGSAGSS